MRFECDHFTSQANRSNAAAIFTHLQTSLRATPFERDAQAFGHIMRASPTHVTNTDVSVHRLDAVYRMNWLRKRMSAVSWSIVDLFIIYASTPAEIARYLKADRKYIAIRVREALSELAATYRSFDTENGASDEHPSYDASQVKESYKQ